MSANNSGGEELSNENGLLEEEFCGQVPDLSFSFSHMEMLGLAGSTSKSTEKSSTGRRSIGATGDSEVLPNGACVNNGTPTRIDVFQVSDLGEGDNGTNRWAEMKSEVGEPLEIMEEMASILDTGLKKESLYWAFKLLQSGVDHRVLAQQDTQWRQEHRLWICICTYTH